MICLPIIKSRSQFSNFSRFVVIFTMTLICSSINVLATPGQISYSTSGRIILIPDNGGYDGRATWEIDLSQAPANAVITSVDVEYWINHTYVADLRVWLTTEQDGEWKEYVLWDREGGSTNDIHEKETGLSTWNGWPVNRKWYFCAADYASDDTGEITQWKIWINYDTSYITPKPIPYYQDFSSGKPGMLEGWDYYSNNEGRIEVTDGQLRMYDWQDGGNYSLNEAILHLDLNGRSGVILTLDHLNNIDETNLLPANFSGHYNGDGIAISADGINWYLLTNLTSSFNDQSFDIDAAIKAAGIGYTSDFCIKFQQYDNYSWDNDGRAFDDIAITATGADPGFRRPFGTWQGTFNSISYGTSGTITNWIMREDYTTESMWELHVGADTGIKVNASCTYTFNSANDRLEFIYNGLATTWVNGQIANIPCTMSVTGTAFRDSASGNYELKLFPQNLPRVVDTGTWQMVRTASIASHVSGIELCVGKNYNDPDVWSDTTYDFCLGLETDDSVSNVQFVSPAGFTYQIPQDSYTQLGDIQTWHYLQGTLSPERSTTSNMIAFWNMDDNTSNNTVVDSSGGNNHGTAQRNTSALTTTGIINGALSFNGISDYIVVPDRDDWTFTSDFTISLWVKFNNFNTRWEGAAFVGHDEGPYETNKWIFSYNQIERKTVFHINGPPPAYPNGGYTLGGNPWTAQTGVWHFLCVSRKGNTFTFYKQGESNGTVVNTAQIPNAASSLTIGWAEGNRTLDGALDNVRIFNKALSDAEIKTLYENRQKNLERWEYVGKFTNMSSLTKYSDGTYTITVKYKDGSQDQTSARFSIPSTSNTIPQPTDTPQLTFPKHNSMITSPVIFRWESCYDDNATSIGLSVEKLQDTGESIDIELPIDATCSDPITLSTGQWQAKLFFDNWYDYNNLDGIAVKVGKFSESDYIFNIGTLSGGLVAHWKMDDNSANNIVVDNSGNLNHGTAQRNTSALAVTGRIKGALSFNGINDYITIPKDRNLITGRNDFTIAGWFNLSNVSTIQNLIAWKESSSAVQFVITDGTNNTGIWACSKWLMKIGYTFSTGTWYHITWTRNGNTWKVYINGSQKGTDVIDSGSLSTPILDYYIGAEATAPSQFLKGLLDEVKIYNYALTDTEIRVLYNEGTGI